MELLATVILIFSAVQMVIAMVNMISDQRMKHAGLPDCLVSVLIPARNEENNIVSILNDLKRQTYSNIEILVFDDQSTDRTAEVTWRCAADDPRIRLLRSDGLPEGWYGKNHACHSLAMKAGGRYLLFLDADVSIENDIIPRAVAQAESWKTALISIFPRQIMGTTGELLTVPVMKYILLSLLPLVLVRRSKYAALSAANGQFMLFNAGMYRTMMPHQKMKDKMAEDIEIARYLKMNSLKVACLATDKDVSCRMYHSFGEAVNGFAKNVSMFFGNSHLLASVFWLITTLGFIPVMSVFGIEGLSLFVTATIITRIAVSVAGCEPVIRNIIFIPFQQLSLLVIIVRSVILKQKKHYVWKGRELH